ncbi:MAG: hypothetical protein ABI376_03795 [Caulobacteraceae bacterium]
MSIVRRTRAEVDLSKIDRAALKAMSEARIAAQIATDPDTAPLFTSGELARARRVTL